MFADAIAPLPYATLQGVTCHIQNPAQSATLGLVFEMPLIKVLISDEAPSFSHTRIARYAS
jgi:hypothetical protein